MDYKNYRYYIDIIYEDTKYDSFFNNMLKHENFNILCSKGYDIIQFIIKDIKDDKKGGWILLHLLARIIENKNFPDYYGDFDKIKEKWLIWWEQNQRTKKIKRVLNKL